MKPCKICGATEYPLSPGGPGICPKCDCWVFDAHTLVWHNNRLSIENDALRQRLGEEALCALHHKRKHLRGCNHK
jgi:hypothetical protein